MKKQAVKIAMTVMGGILLADLAFASSCADLRGELEALRRAQSSLITSLAHNHDLFASTLEDLGSEIELRSSQVPAQATRSMKKTAKAFRQRGQQAQVSAEKLDEATSDLIQRIGHCLK